MGKKLPLSLLLLAIFLVAALLRFYKLSDFPVGFHVDEASLGYNGYSLLLTGRDDNGNFLPLYIDMFGDNRPSGYHYLTILPIVLFGLTEFATRFPGALFGSFTVVSFFFLVRILFGNKKVALLAALFLALSPWHVVLSRASAETVVALFFIISGFTLLISSLVTQRKRSHFIGGTLCMALSFFFYHTPRVFVVLLLLAVFTAVKHLWLGKKLQQTVLVSFAAISFLSFFLVFLVRGGTGRFSQVNIFGFPETKLVLEEQIREDGVVGTRVVATRFFHNKIINYSFTFLSNYFAYFTADFLFLNGGLPIWYKVPRVGLVYLMSLPFFLYGVFLLANAKERLAKLPLLWMLIAPVTAAITVDDVPNIQRSIILFPMIELIAAWGVFNAPQLLSVKNRRVFIPVVTILFLFNSFYFFHQYFVHTKVNRPWHRNVGFKEMIETVSSSPKYKKIIVTKSHGGLYPLVLFYTRYNPKSYQEEGFSKNHDYRGFGRFFFVPMDCPSFQRDDRFPKVNPVIYVDRGDCPEIGNFAYRTIRRTDGTVVFRIAYE